MSTIEEKGSWLWGKIKEGVGWGSDQLDRSKRAEQMYGKIDESNFGVPGAAGRQRRLLSQADMAAGRRDPRAAMSQQFRSGQQGLVGLLQQQAMGQGPSAAQLQLKNALSRNVSAQQALQATGGSARSASQQASSLGASMANQAAQARVQEQLGAQGLLSQTLQGARGQDQALNIANMRAQLEARGLNDAQIARLMELELRQAGMQQRGGLALEQNRTQRFSSMLGVPTAGEQILGGASSLLGLV